MPRVALQPTLNANPRLLVLLDCVSSWYAFGSAFYLSYLCLDTDMLAVWVMMRAPVVRHLCMVVDTLLAYETNPLLLLLVDPVRAILQ